MSKPQLYIKNEKGRYEPYKLPEPEVDNKLYRKINGKYYPWEMDLKNDHLPEGVWVITRQKSCISYTSGSYLREQFKLDKASDIKEVSLAELGSLEKLTREVLDALPSDYRNRTTNDLVHLIVGKVYEITKQKENQTVEIPCHQKQTLADSIKRNKKNKETTAQ